MNNFPRYKFAKETEPELIKFLKVARDNRLSNRNCDLKKFELWSKLLPLDQSLLDLLDKSVDENEATVVNISSDEESLKKNSKENVENKEVEVSENINEHIIKDIACAIKENLEEINDLSENAKENIINCSSNEHEELFKLLNENLSTEEVFYLGKSLQNFAPVDLVAVFCDFVLIPAMQKGYCDHLSTLVGSLYSSKYCSSINKKLLTKMCETNEKDTKVFLQYLSNFNPTNKSILLRDFIFNTENLNKNHLMAVEILLNNQVEYEVLNKLIKMLSNVAEDYVTDKAFGKLLMNIIQYLGTNVLLVEQPLRHIIAGHKSIWKSKLEKTFNTNFEDTMMFTQSFRE